jgi:hypothetical protein
MSITPPQSQQLLIKESKELLRLFYVVLQQHWRRSCLLATGNPKISTTFIIFYELYE